MGAIGRHPGGRGRHRGQRADDDGSGQVEDLADALARLGSSPSHGPSASISERIHPSCPSCWAPSSGSFSPGKDAVAARSASPTAYSRTAIFDTTSTPTPSTLRTSSPTTRSHSAPPSLCAPPPLQHRALQPRRGESCPLPAHVALATTPPATEAVVGADKRRPCPGLRRPDRGNRRAIGIVPPSSPFPAVASIRSSPHEPGGLDDNSVSFNRRAGRARCEGG